MYRMDEDIKTLRVRHLNPEDVLTSFPIKDDKRMRHLEDPAAKPDGKNNGSDCRTGPLARGLTTVEPEELD